MNRRDRSKEQELFDWLLVQRLLHQAGRLEPHKVAQLNERAPEWNSDVSDTDIAHALAKVDVDLNTALETWWNAKAMPGSPCTFAELRERAMRESGLAG
jgi:hypothetical protein